MQEKEVLQQTIGALNSTISSLTETAILLQQNNAALQKRIDELTEQIVCLNRQINARRLKKL